jgi:predicted double-glycine peptidase
MGVTTFGFAREPVRGRYRLAPLFSLATLVLVQGCGSLPTSTDEPLFQRRYRGYTYCTVGVVKQSRHDTCGPACLSSVLTYWDIALPESGILEKYPTPEPRSYLLLELRAIAEAEGLKAYAVSMDEEPRHKVEEQISKGRPLICAVRPPIGLYLFDPVPILGPAWRALAWTLYPRKEHFVVVAGLDPQRLLIMDPAYGFATLPWSRFEAAWSQMKHACLLVAQ